jgi:hypothetical protein
MDNFYQGNLFPQFSSEQLNQKEKPKPIDIFNLISRDVLVPLNGKKFDAVILPDCGGPAFAYDGYQEASGDWADETYKTNFRLFLLRLLSLVKVGGRLVIAKISLDTIVRVTGLVKSYLPDTYAVSTVNVDGSAMIIIFKQSPMPDDKKIQAGKINKLIRLHYQTQAKPYYDEIFTGQN